MAEKEEHEDLLRNKCCTEEEFEQLDRRTADEKKMRQQVVSKEMLGLDFTLIIFMCFQ